MFREPRFPGIDWYCDHCGALLNTQKGFDDHKYTWKCKNCGYKNSISWDAISFEDPLPLKLLLYLIGFISYVGFWTAIMLAVSMFVFHADKSLYMTPFLTALGTYLFAFILSLLVEFCLRHTKFSLFNLIKIIFRNLKEDIICPFMYFKELLSILGNLVLRLFSRGHYHKPINFEILFFAIVYTLIIVFEFIALSKIIGFGFNDWINLITSVLPK